MAGRPRTSNVVKILHGSARRDRMRDEVAVMPRDPLPEVPPWETLADDEKAILAWLHEVMLVKGVHGRPDGLLMLRLTRMLIRVRSLEAKVATLGMVFKHPTSGKPMQSPFYTALVAEENEMRRLMNELGFSPSGRLKFAPPSSTRPTEGSWEAFD
jgi:hypothetical protein